MATETIGDEMNQDQRTALDYWREAEALLRLSLQCRMNRERRHILVNLITALAAIIHVEAKGIQLAPSADITDSLQSALNYVGSANPTNVTVSIPAGDYQISRTLNLPSVGFPNSPVLGAHSGIRITGAGLSETKLIWITAPSVGLNLGSLIGYEGVTVENLALIGPGGSNDSIGLAIGAPGPNYGWSGWNQTVRNVALMNWGTGAAVTNQWQIVFDNCVVKSNSTEGLRFAGSHGVSVQNCRIGGGWNTPIGIGVGFHVPLNAGYGDNAQLINCMFGPCIVGIYNEELNLSCINDHLEACGCYYSLRSLAAQTTIIGGYTLDGQNAFTQSWTNGYPAQMQLNSSSARQTVIENCAFTSALYPPRAIFEVVPDTSGYAVPIYVGPGKIDGLYGGSKVTLYPIGTHHRFWQRPVASAVKSMAQ